MSDYYHMCPSLFLNCYVHVGLLHVKNTIQVYMEHRRKGMYDVLKHEKMRPSQYCIQYNTGGCPPCVCHKFYIQLDLPISPEIMDGF